MCVLIYRSGFGKYSYCCNKKIKCYCLSPQLNIPLQGAFPWWKPTSQSVLLPEKIFLAEELFRMLSTLVLNLGPRENRYLQVPSQVCHIHGHLIPLLSFFGYCTSSSYAQKQTHENSPHHSLNTIYSAQTILQIH